MGMLLLFVVVVMDYVGSAVVMDVEPPIGRPMVSKYYYYYESSR
jgi:hypothetical protein